MADSVDTFERARPRLGAIAYRILGSATDAEDVIQDVYLRWQAAAQDEVRVPEAWLTKVTANLCLTLLDSAPRRRESYVGTWLPEPLAPSDPLLGPAEVAEQREAVSYAVQVLLEKLSPQERAVFVLREAFAYPHREIAEMLDITESNSQQLLRRAKQRVGEAPQARDVPEAQAHSVVQRFLAAAATGQTGPLLELLTSDAVVVGDGGGQVPVRPRPLVGGAEVAGLVRNLFRFTPAQQRLAGGAPRGYFVTVDGEPALATLVEDRLIGVMVFELRTHQGEPAVHGLRYVADPDKLVRFAQHWSPAGEPLFDTSA